MASIVGGHCGANLDDLKAVAHAVKNEVVAHASDNNQDDFATYEVVEGTQQLVAGMIFNIKIKVGDNRHIKIKVFRSLPPVSHELKSVEYMAAHDAENKTEPASPEKEKEPESIYDTDLPKRIIVGRGRPLSFYVDRARRVFRIEEEVQITGRGDNISTACKLVEALKRQKICVTHKISTGMDVQPYFNAAGDAKWGQPTAVIVFKLKRGEFGHYIADYQQRKVIEIFENKDEAHTGMLSVKEVEALDFAGKFYANEEQVANGQKFLAGCGGEMNLPTFIKYASTLIHPMLKNKVFKEVLATRFDVEVAGMPSHKDDGDTADTAAATGN